MRKIALGIFFLIGLISCDVINESLKVVNSTQPAGSSKPSLTNEEVISGLKEALQVGIKN
jgi:hypothetical protein